jgi:hypothetical protein
MTTAMQMITVIVAGKTALTACPPTPNMEVTKQRARIRRTAKKIA